MSNINDKVYTPEFIVDEVLDEFLPLICNEETVLEPFRGEGAFYDKLCIADTAGVSWCEIDLGVDFFEWDKRVDWIITNPPYSIFKEILPKMLAIADNIVIVIPVNKLLSSMPRLMDIKRAGHNIKHVHYLGSGRQLKFPFGFPVGAIYIERGYVGHVKHTYADRCYKAKHK
tara:strand:+ start:204 stop:719 length:516 start_codon:yes stop_codon:yes gene_type:complete